MDSETTDTVDWHAKWVWARGAESLPNATIAVRREFELSAAPARAVVHIAAKDRYFLFVNASFVQEGPPPCHPESQYYDTHDVTSLLRAGANAVAIVAHNNVVANHGKPGGHWPV